MDHKELKDTLRGLTQSLNSLSNFLNQVPNEFKKDLSREQVEEINEQINTFDIEGKAQELTQKFDSIKSKL